MLRHDSQRGLTLAEALVAMTLSFVLLAAALSFFEFALKDTSRTVARIDSRRVSQVTLDHVVRILRQASTGVVTDNPANCLACHEDTDGDLEDNPNTDCPEDMTIPIGPLELGVWTVDPEVEEAPWTPAEEGNALTFNGDIETAPDEVDPELDLVWERKAFYPVKDELAEGLLLMEDADHDGDEVPDAVYTVAYGIQDLLFSIVEAEPPRFEGVSQVSNGCFVPGSPSSCHGMGNAVGPDLYGDGTLDPDDPVGEVWLGQHPDSQSVLGIRVRLRTGTLVRLGAEAKLHEVTLEALVRPRGLGS